MAPSPQQIEKSFFSTSISLYSFLKMLKMDTSQSVFNLCCELKILGVKNIELKSADLFVRCYLSAGSNRRVQLNTKEISTNSDLYWDESFSLECLGTEDAINSLRQGNVVLELRCRNKSVPVLGKFGGSKLLGRAEIPWKTIFESPNMENATWVRMIPKNRRVNEDVKPPAVQVSMKIRVPEERIKRGKKDRLRGLNDECGCMDCSGCHPFADFDIYAVGFALEAF